MHKLIFLFATLIGKKLNFIQESQYIFDKIYKKII